MSIVSRVFMLILSAMLGFGQGFQPVAGYNFGAKRYDRLKDAFWFCLKVGVAGLFVLSAIGFVLAPQIMSMFRPDDAEVIAIGSLAFRLQCLSMPLHAVVVVSNMLFQSIGKAKQATFVAVARQGLFFLPLIAVLPQTIGLLGVQCSQPIADVITFASCVPLLTVFFKKLNKMIPAVPESGNTGNETTTIWED